MISDMHVHTNFSSDSTTPAELQIERAVELGMKQICITDHQDYDAPPLLPDNFNFLIGNTGEMKPYITRLQQLKEKYMGKIEVLLGIELGLQAHLGEKLKTLMEQWTMDFALGSSHYFGGMDGGDRRLYEQRTAKEACTQYFLEELENIQSFHQFDVIGHIDFVLRHAPDGLKNFKYADYGDLIDEMLKIVINQGKGIECNTSPMAKGLSEPNPNMQILRRYKELGGEIITFGSDAHTPNRIGENFQEVGEMVKSCGFQYYTVFKSHKPYFERLV